ncbi:hypothetical protein V6Z11_D09G129300 [Gossypium hirsutum]
MDWIKRKWKKVVSYYSNLRELIPASMKTIEIDTAGATSIHPNTPKWQRLKNREALPCFIHQPKRLSTLTPMIDLQSEKLHKKKFDKSTSYLTQKKAFHDYKYKCKKMIYPSFNL